ncbi:T9SS type A sorting domain-containing protein [Pseudochryseolinea flava]|nr:T9SS type A sorting domain-containing protein [Pseudochryseolinea flava]
MVLCLTMFSVVAQNKFWDKRFGGTAEDLLSAVVATPDGGYLLGGTSRSDQNGDKSQPQPPGTWWPLDFWVVRIDASGNKVWDKSFGDIGLDKLTSIVNTTDNGFLLFGSGWLDGHDDYIVIKIDANGNVIWNERYDNGWHESLTSVVSTADNGFVLAGFSYSATEEDDYVIWLVKIDADGVLVWERVEQNYNILNTMIVTAEGGFLTGGRFALSNDEGPTVDYWINKTESNGDLLWEKSFGGSGSDVLSRLLSTSDGGYLLGGSSNSAQGGDKSQPSQGGDDYWIVKVDANGNKQWDKRFGGSGTDNLQLLLATLDGGYLLGGSSNSGQNGDKGQPSWGGDDYWIVKIDGSGQKIWDKRFGGSMNDLIAAMIPTFDAGFVVGGSSDSGQDGDKTQPSRGGLDYWVVKVDGNQMNQVINFPPVPDKTFGDAPFSLAATATSGLPVAYAIAPGSEAFVSIEGNVVTLLQPGTATIIALQPGNTFYHPAVPDSVSFAISSPYCFAFTVSNFIQGRTKQGKVVEAIRSNAQLALGAPQDNDTYNFVSLGFGGSITLELSDPLYDNNGYDPDFILVETSFGRADEKCFAGGNTFNYPETVVIEVSDGTTWKSLPDSYCRTSFVDISSVITESFQHVKFIRIKDFSNKEYFESNADGFDVDGLIVCPEEVRKAFATYTNGRVAGANVWDAAFFNRAPNEADDNDEAIKVFPNPAREQITVEFLSEVETHESLQIISVIGVIKRNNLNQLQVGKNVLTEDVANLTPGVYLIKVGTRAVRFVKE